MRCPRCMFVGELVEGLCPQCRYKPKQIATDSLHPHTLQPIILQPVKSSSITTQPITPSPAVPNPMTPLPTTQPLVQEFSLRRGDTLGQGRYRLTEPVVLPKSQREQGGAWMAIDTHSSLRRRVLLRKIRFPVGFQGKAEQIVESIVTRFERLSSHPGIPAVIDVLYEQDSYYLVLEHPIGETLASLIKEQGGALRERDVAEYGRQLCEILAELASQYPPVIHGGISPDTIIINSENRQVYLVFLPLLPLKPLPKENAPLVGYLAPEQLRGSAVLSSDLYSLAATLHHAVTGYSPHERLAFFYPPARRLNPIISPTMEAILLRALHLSVSQRYPHPADMQKELAALIASYPPEESQQNSVLHYPQSPLTGKNNLGIVAIIGIALVLLLILLIAVPPLLKSTNPNYYAQATVVAQQAALNTELSQEMQNFQKEGIGVSDGRLVFDTYSGRSDTNLKKQAASALQQGNVSAAVSFLNQAVNADPTDGEAQIYNENIHLQQNNSPYVTLAVGLPIDGSAIHLGSDREQLEAVYLAQHEANSQNLLPRGLKLRILVANSGAKNTDVATVAQFIANRVSKAGNLDHLIGVVGWYNSSQTINARDIIASVHLPLVAQTASSVKLSGSSPYFFRVAPPDNVQGQALGTLLANQLNAKRVLILSDSTDSYSVSLANAVAARVTALGSTFTTAAFTEDTTTVDQYQQLIANNVNSNVPADVVFLAGFNVDGVRLAHAIGNLARATPSNSQLGQLKVVGGDALDSGLLLGEGDDADAAFARENPQDMRRLIFTTFADFNEWNSLNLPQDQLPLFTTDWKSTYQSSLVSNNAPDPAYNGLMIYDAVGVLVYTPKWVVGPITGETMRNTLASLGKGKIPAYQGFSGKIRFDKNGDPIDKAVVILAVQDNGSGNQIAVQQVIGSFR